MKTLIPSEVVQASEPVKLSTGRTKMLVPQGNLETMLEREINERCFRKVTKRLALQLAQAVLQDDHDGMFFAEKLAERLQVRLRKEVALKEIYIDRPSKR